MSVDQCIETPPQAGLRSVATLAAPVGLGLFPLGIAFGLVVVHAGLAWWWAPVFTGVVYAGSLEFLLVPMAAAAVPLGQVALTALIVNSRHLFYALSFPLHRVRGRFAKTYSTFALTDEAYALTSAPATRVWSTRQIIALQVLLQAFWVSGATVGALLGATLPLDQLRGLDFALTALFVVLVIDAYGARPDPATALLALGCAVVAMVVVPGQMLPAAFAGYTALLLLRRRLAP